MRVVDKRIVCREFMQADGGVFEMNSCSLEPETCIFHEDDSGRIIHISASQVR